MAKKIVQPPTKSTTDQKLKSAEEGRKAAELSRKKGKEMGAISRFVEREKQSSDNKAMNMPSDKGTKVNKYNRYSGLSDKQLGKSKNSLPSSVFVSNTSYTTPKPTALATKAPKKLMSKSISKSNTNDSASNYRKLAKAQMDSSNQMGVKNNPMGMEVLKRSVKNTEKAIRAEKPTKKPTVKK